MKRRTFLQTSLASASLGAAAGYGEEEKDFPGIIDSNVSLFRWPFRRLPLDDTKKLVDKFRFLGVKTALAGSFDGVFYRDLSSANRRLAEECDRFPELIPIGSVNPTLPGWELDLEQCVGELKMPGIRLHPNLHGYTLSEPRFQDLLRQADEAGVFVQLAVTLEDVRTQPEKILSPDVDLSPLPVILEKTPSLSIQLLNLRPRAAQLKMLSPFPNLFFDTARADGTDGVASLIAGTGNDRVAFGTHAPFLIPEAALIRVHESALEKAQLRAVLRENAVKLSGFDPA